MKSIIYITSLFIFIACNSDEKESVKIRNQVKYYSGKTIAFSDSLILLHNNKIKTLSESKLFKQEPKIITFINGGCATCINEIVVWDEFQKELMKKNKEDNLFFIITNINLSLFKKMYYPEIPLEYQIILDSSSSFIRTNHLLGLTLSNTLLLNTNNEIHFIGNPTINDKIFKIYLNEL